MENSGRKNTITITNCDSYGGQSLACYFLQESERQGRGHTTIKVTARDRKHCENLREMGAKVYEVDFEKPETLRQAFRDCDYVVLIPEITESRLRDAERTIEALEQERVRNVLLQSFLGADTKETDLHQLREYGRIEQMFMERLGDRKDICVCIFRYAFLQQLFLLWAPMIDQERRLRLNIGQNGRLSPVDLCDIVRATYDMFSGKHGKEKSSCPFGIQKQDQGFQLVPLDQRHHKQRYTLTGPETLEGEDIARRLDNALKERRDIRFEDEDRREMRRYFDRLRTDQLFARQCSEQERNCGRPLSEVLSSAFGGSEAWKHHKGKDRYHGHPRREHLTETKIELILDMLEIAKHGRADFVSDDLEKLIDHEPENLEDFFRRYRDEFERGYQNA